MKQGDRKIVYEDMNKLYSWTISQNLPTGDNYEFEVSKRNEKKTYYEHFQELQMILYVDKNKKVICNTHPKHSKKTKLFPFLPDKKQ